MIILSELCKSNNFIENITPMEHINPPLWNKVAPHKKVITTTFHITFPTGAHDTDHDHTSTQIKDSFLSLWEKEGVQNYRNCCRLKIEIIFKPEILPYSRRFYIKGSILKQKIIAIKSSFHRQVEQIVYLMIFSCLYLQPYDLIKSDKSAQKSIDINNRKISVRHYKVMNKKLLAEINNLQ